MLAKRFVFSVRGGGGFDENKLEKNRKKWKKLERNLLRK